MLFPRLVRVVVPPSVVYASGGYGRIYAFIVVVYFAVVVLPTVVLFMLPFDQKLAVFSKTKGLAMRDVAVALLGLLYALVLHAGVGIFIAVLLPTVSVNFPGISERAIKAVIMAPG